MVMRADNCCVLVPHRQERQRHNDRIAWLRGGEWNHKRRKQCILDGVVAEGLPEEGCK